MNDKERNNLQEIITQSLEVIKEKMGAGYAPEKVNLAEMERLWWRSIHFYKMGA